MLEEKLGRQQLPRKGGLLKPHLPHQQQLKITPGLVDSRVVLVSHRFRKLARGPSPTQPELNRTARSTRSRNVPKLSAGAALPAHALKYPHKTLRQALELFCMRWDSKDSSFSELWH